ncbi:hypothetical protein NBRC116494_08390 [Aurantivibrio plasticivorans]
MSHEERVAALEEQLEGSMRDYDGMILRERNQVLARANDDGSEEEVAAIDRSVAYYEEADLSAPGIEQVGPAGAGLPGMDEATGSSGSGPDGRGNGGGGPGQNADIYPPPNDIPDAEDDDVVARQIREAALHERDPALREKLWDEYRKYKGITK